MVYGVGSVRKKPANECVDLITALAGCTTPALTTLKPTHRLYYTDYTCLHSELTGCTALTTYYTAYTQNAPAARFHNNRLLRPGGGLSADMRVIDLEVNLALVK
jgi:hypothetical protein